MGSFAFQVTDPTGKRRSGTVTARDLAEARALLERAGHRVEHLADQRPAGGQTAPQVVRRRRGGAKARLFFFQQLGSMFHAGMNPYLMLTELAKRPGWYQEAFTRSAEQVKGGMAMSDAFAQYPDLFEPSDCGVIRAGEVSGQVPAAFSLAAQHAGSAHSLGKWSRGASFWFLGLPPLMVVAIVAQRGALDSIRKQDAAGGTLPAVETVRASVGQQAIQVAPWALGVFLLAGALLWFWMSPGRRTARERAALALPLFGRRVRAESFQAFSWALAALMQAGTAPFTAFRLACDAMPNTVLADQMRAGLAGARENTPLSAIVRQAGVLPEDSIAMLSTGEMTGQTPQMLDQIARANESEFRMIDPAARRVLVTLVFLLSAVCAFAFLVYWWKSYYQGIYDIFGNEQTPIP